MTDINETQAFRALGPDAILDAVESLGFHCDGRLQALNSYENRVYQIGLEDGAPLVSKFYRPARWSDAAIQEEHDFCLELAAEELPVVAPWRSPDGRTLQRFGAYRFALFPRQAGRAPELDDPQPLEQLGRLLARVHNLGALRPFVARPSFDWQHWGEESCRYLLEQGFIPPDLVLAYRTLAEDLLVRVRAAFDRAGPVERLRLHGDCHPGNILWSNDQPYLVDLDDCRSGPAIQDLWMLLSGERPQMTFSLACLLDGYTQFRDFDPRELHLLEALRTLRIMHYAAWLARRWEDPAFPRAFTWFNSQHYWQDHILALREQAALLDEPPLVWN